MMSILKIIFFFWFFINASGFLFGQNKVQINFSLTQPIFYYPKNGLLQTTRENSKIGFSLGLSYDHKLYRKLYLRSYCNFTNYNEQYLSNFPFADSLGKTTYSDGKIWQINNALEAGAALVVSFNWFEIGGGLQYGQRLNTIIIDKNPITIDGVKTSKNLPIKYYENSIFSIPIFLGVKYNRYTLFSMVSLSLNTRINIENVYDEYIHIYRLGLMVRLGKTPITSSNIH